MSDITQVNPAQTHDGTVAADRPCSKCGYNLRGLPLAGVCPECGEAIQRKRAFTRFADNLSDAPPRYLRQVRDGLFMMAAGLMIWPALLSVRVAMGGFPQGVGQALLVGAPALFGLLWWGGIVLISRPRPIHEADLTPDGVLDLRPLRQVNQWTPGLLVLTLVLVAGLPLLPAGALVRAGTITASILSVLSLFTLIPLAIFLSSLADWAGETGIGDRLRGSAWVLMICGTGAVAGWLVGRLLGGVGMLAGGPLQLLSLFAWAFTLGATLVLAFSVLQLANTARWAIHNQRTALARDRRLEERRRRDEEESFRAREEALARVEAGVSDLPPPPVGDGPIPLVDDAPELHPVDATLPAMSEPGAPSPGKIRHTKSVIGGLRSAPVDPRDRSPRSGQRSRGGRRADEHPAADDGPIPLAPDEDEGA